MDTRCPRRRQHDPADSEAHVHRRDSDAAPVLHLHSRIGDCEASIATLLEGHQALSDSMSKLAEATGRMAAALEARRPRRFWFCNGLGKGHRDLKP